MSEYKNIDKIKPETLLALMREVLDKSTDFSYFSGIQPFFMSFRKQKYYVYVKNVSSAYFSDRDKTTRAQLPIKSEFNSIKSSPYPFVFLGYDGLNDVFVCWNYHIAKERLNVGKSVSFYSRTFFQSEVKEGEFIRRKLKNGDIPVLFKRSNLIEFFEKIDTFFPTENISRPNYNLNFGKHNYEVEFKEYLKLYKKLSDKSIKNYSNALKGRISEGLKKHFIHSLDSIYFIDKVSVLEELNVKLFEIKEYKELNITGKNMYSCAFDNYISFIIHYSIYKVNDENNKVSDVKEEYCKEGKLLKITDIDLINQIQPLIDSNRLLSAAQLIGSFYLIDYPNMELSDWINLVKKLKNLKC